MAENENREEEKKVAMDKLMREKIICHVLQIAHIPRDINNIEDIKTFYQRNFDRYMGTYLDATIVPYQYGNFWFNEAGFQFLWRDHKGYICTECLTWQDVKRRIKT